MSRIFAGPHAEIEPWLRAAEATLPDDPAERAALHGQVYAMRGFAAGLYGEADTALECSRRALDLLPEADIDMRAMATYAEGLALRLAGVAEPARVASAPASGLYRAGWAYGHGDHYPDGQREHAGAGRPAAGR